MKEVLRPLSAQEELYWRLTFNDQIHPVIAAEIEGGVTRQLLQKAFEMLQDRHPLLRVAIEMPTEGGLWTQPVFVRSREPVSIREERASGPSAVAEQIEAELAEPFLAGKGPLIRAVLMRRESNDLLVLSASHSVADGMSLLHVLRELLMAMDGAVLDGLPLAATAESLLQLAPVRPPHAPPEESQEVRKAGQPPTVIMTALSKEETDSLLNAARAHGTTLHSVLVAAFVWAMRQMDDSFAAKPIRVISPVSTRDMLGAGSSVGLYFTSPMSIFEPAATDPWEAAAQVRRDVIAAATRSSVLQATLGMQSMTGRALTNAAAAAVLEGAFAIDALASNLGRLPFGPDFGAFRILRVWGPAGLAGTEQAQTLGAVTTHGELALTLTSRRPIPQILAATVKKLKALCAEPR